MVFYLSDAPQADPQAAGVSFGWSEAPQADPQAAGVSAGLSEAPQAVPQEAAVPAAGALLHSYRFESAMMLPPPFLVMRRSSIPVTKSIIKTRIHAESTHNKVGYAQKSNRCFYAGIDRIYSTR